MVEQRQIAERQRQAGNAAFKQQQYSEALRCYQAGLEVQRHSMVLHANAAAAALKLNCYVQALEHCDKVGGCVLAEYAAAAALALCHAKSCKAPEQLVDHVPGPVSSLECGLCRKC
jgi:tetratricopeptide (TPR) repeat protein